ncbi:MAG: S8 family serine peptidase, partial [Nocardioides sp.]|nr:S8 family serine peptidase [Nocardioides sp.]
PLGTPRTPPAPTDTLGTPTVPLTGADVAHEEGYDGAGVKVAVLDTGYDSTHPDLQGRVAESANFITWNALEDRNGHGTHTASTIAGTGAASHGRYAGMAPGADLLVGKVLDNTGSGSDSAIIAGMQWAVDEGAKVVSMSLGTTGLTCEGPDVDAVQALSDRALFVIAAGNSGLPGSISTPGCAPDALTVGAVDRQDQTAYFSSRGPVFGGTLAKPDIASQGVDVVAARAGGKGDQAYVSYSGTSMATPHVAGGAALVLQARPDLTPTELKDVLTSSARDTGTDVLEQGAGPLDVAHALDETVVAAPNQQLADLAYPQRSLPDTSASVPLTNLGVHAERLSLHVEELVGGDGRTPVPAAAVTVRPQLTIPARGAASAAVTIDPRVRLADAAYGTVTGRLVGTGPGGERVEVPFGVHVEEPSADLTIDAVDRFGNPAESPSTWDLIDPTRGQAWHYGLTAGTATVRVPLGRYVVLSDVATRDEPTNASDVENLTFLADHSVAVEKDTTVTLDARRATRLDWRTDRPSQSFGYAAGYTYDMTGQGIKMASYALAPSYVNRLYTLSEGRPDDRFSFIATTRRYAPRATLSTASGAFDYWSVQQTPPLHGHGSAPLVTSTAATAATDDLSGKVALIDAAQYVPIDQTAKDAAKAGATAMIMDYPGVVGRATPSASGLTIPVLTVTPDVADRLKTEIAAGPTTLTWSGEQPETSPYAYNLAALGTGTVASGTQVVHDRDLSAQHAGYYTQGDTRNLWTDVMFRLPGQQTSVYASGTSVAVLAPMQRTDYFTASPDVQWTSVVAPYFANAGGAFDGPRARTAGTETTSWYKAPIGIASSTDGTPLFDRDTNRLTTTMPYFGDAGLHDGAGAYPDLHSVTYQVDGALPTTDGSLLILPDSDALVDVTSTFERREGYGGIQWHLGLASSTEWTFHTDASRQGAQPALLPRLDLPLRLDNTAPAGAPLRLDLSAAADSVSLASVPLRSVRVWYATGAQSTVSAVPGSAWTELPVTGSGRSFRTYVPGAAAGYVHLKVAMVGADGSTVTQTLVRAYAVR